MSSAIGEVQELVGGLAASSIRWRTSSSPSTSGGSGGVGSSSLSSSSSSSQQQGEYLHLLHRLTAVVSVLSDSDVKSLITTGGIATSVVSLAIEHALLGMLPWLTIATWEDFLFTYLQIVHKHVSMAHLTQSLWDTVVRLSKDRAGTSAPTSTAALCAALRLLRVMLIFCPVELQAVRKQLPHPTKTVSVAVRVSAFGAVPHVIANLRATRVVIPPPAVPHVPSSSSVGSPLTRTEGTETLGGSMLSFGTTPSGAQASGRHCTSNASGSLAHGHASTANHSSRIPPATALGGGSCGAGVDGGGTACNVVFLDDDFLEYFHKGIEVGEQAVREAAVAALCTTLEMGVGLDGVMAPKVLDLLLAACEDASFPASSRFVRNTGLVLGHLLCLYQTGFALSTVDQVFTGLRTVRPLARVCWDYFGSPDPVTAGRLVNRLLRPHLPRVLQRVLVLAITRLFTMCVRLQDMREALRALFVLLIPTSRDPRQYMVYLITDALAMWAKQLPSNGFRVALVSCLRELATCPNEAKVVVHTALLAIRDVVAMLASTDKISSVLAQELIAAARAQPALVGVVGEIIGSLAVTSPFSQRRLLLRFTNCSRAVAASVGVLTPHSATAAAASSGDASPLSMETGGEPSPPSPSIRAPETRKTVGLPLEFVVTAKAMLSAAPRMHKNADFQRCLVANVVAFSSREYPALLDEVHFRLTEHFFQFATALFEYYKDDVSVFLVDKVESSVTALLSRLVGCPSDSSFYLRAASAVCAHLLARGNAKSREKMLCIGLLEGQLVNGGAAFAHPTSLSQKIVGDGSSRVLHMAKLKRDVYQLIAAQPWPECRDEASVRWLVTQALNDVDTCCQQRVPVQMSADVIFHSSAVPFLQDLRRQVPTSAQKPLSECGEAAIALVAWGVKHFSLAQGGIPFCVDVLRRVTGLHTKIAQHCNSYQGADVVSAGSITVTGMWNVLCTMASILSVFVNAEGKAEAHGGGAVTNGINTTAEAERLHNVWRTFFAEHATQWRTISMEWVSPFASSGSAGTVGSFAALVPLDVQVIASKVVAWLLCLSQQVDSYTSQLIRTSQEPNRDNRGLLLVMSELHVCCYQYPNSFSTATLPMAMSFMAEVMKRHASCGAEGMITLMVGCLRLASVLPVQADSPLTGALIAMALAPVTVSSTTVHPTVFALAMGICANANFEHYDDDAADGRGSDNAQRLQQHSSKPSSSGTAFGALSAVARGILSHCISARYDAVVESGKDANAMIGFIRAALAPSRIYRYQQEKCDVATVIRLRALDILKAEVVFRNGIIARSCALPGPLAIPPTREVLLPVHRYVSSEEVLASIARLWQDCMNVCASSSESIHGTSCSGSDYGKSLTVVDATVMIDLATGDAARAAWGELAAGILPSDSESFAIRALLRDIKEVMLTKAPDMATAREYAGALLLAGAASGAYGEDEDGCRGGNGDEGQGIELCGPDAMLADEYDTEDRRKGGGAASPGKKKSGNHKRFLSPQQQQEQQDAKRRGCGGAVWCGDVAAKEALMQLLVHLVETYVPEDEDGLYASEEVSVRHAVLDVAVMAAPQGEALPKLLDASTNLLLAIVRCSGRRGGNAASSFSGESLLVDWKVQLIATIRSIVQLSVFSVAQACALVKAFMYSAIADDTSMHRVVRGATLLLAMLDRMDTEGEGDCVHEDEGRLVRILARVAIRAGSLSDADSAGDFSTQVRWPRTREAALLCLASDVGQVVLTMLCNQQITLIAGCSGFMPPEECVAYAEQKGEVGLHGNTFRTPTTTPAITITTDNNGTSKGREKDSVRGHKETTFGAKLTSPGSATTIPTLENGGETCGRVSDSTTSPATAALRGEPQEMQEAGKLLRYVALLCADKQDEQLGPSLRHSAGCLACLVMATYDCSVRPVREVVKNIGAVNQSIIVKIAYATLVDPSYVSRSLLCADGSSKGDEELCLLEIIVRANIAKSQRMAHELIDMYVPSSLLLEMRKVVATGDSGDASGAGVGGLPAVSFSLVPGEERSSDASCASSSSRLDGSADMSTTSSSSASVDLPLPSVPMVATLLQLALDCDCDLDRVQNLLALLPVDYFMLAPPEYIDAIQRCCLAEDAASLLIVATSSASGLVLAERLRSVAAADMAVSAAVIASGSGSKESPSVSASATLPLNTASLDNSRNQQQKQKQKGHSSSFLAGPAVPQVALRVLREALDETADPLLLVRFMWGRTIASGARTSSCLVFWCLLASEEDETLVVKCGPAMCHVMNELIRAGNPTHTAHQDRLITCVKLLTCALSVSPCADLLWVLLRPVGTMLMTETAREFPIPLREAIRQLAQPDAVRLREFMQLSAMPSM